MQKYFWGFEPVKMHCEFKYTTNAFQDESWDLSNFICYEGSLKLSNIILIKLFLNINNKFNKRIFESLLKILD